MSETRKILNEAADTKKYIHMYFNVVFPALQLQMAKHNQES